MANTFIVEYVGDDENKCFRNYVKTLDVVDRPTRGDLVRMVPEDEYDKYSVWSDYYRNEHISIVNKWGDLEELDYTIDEDGALPSSYRLYEEDDYFKQSHWVREGEPLFGHAHYLWLTNEGLLDKCKYTKNNEITCDFKDVRENPHKLIYKYSKNTEVMDFSNIMSKPVIMISLNDFDDIDDSIIVLDDS